MKSSYVWQFTTAKRMITRDAAIAKAIDEETPVTRTTDAERR